MWLTGCQAYYGLLTFCWGAPSLFTKTKLVHILILFCSVCRNSDEENSEPEYEYTQKLALNEVFIGESHAARVSYYDVQLDDGPMMKQKSSGITICTGTGSTSW